MDVNGTRMHLVLGEADWTRGALDPTVGYDREREELTLLAQPFLAPPSTQALPLEITARRGAARDGNGAWYQVDDRGTGLLVGDRPFWPPVPVERAGAIPQRADFAPQPPPPMPPGPLAGAAVTSDQHLVVGAVEPAGLLVFDLEAGGTPERSTWPAAVPFRPFDLATRPGGGVLVLDRQARLLWELDRTMRVLSRATHDGAPRSFLPDGPAPAPAPTPPCLPVDRPTTADGWPLDADAVEAGAEPVAVDVGVDGTALVLFRHVGGGALRAYRDGVALAPAVALPGPPGMGPVTGHDLAVLAPTATSTAADATVPIGRAFVLERAGDQVLEYAVGLQAGELTLTLAPRYLPVRLAGGRALVAVDGEIYSDVAGNWLPIVEQPRRRYPTAGSVRIAVLDGEEPGCVWHRLFLDAHLPSQTAVALSAVASDDRDAVAAPDPLWRRQPDPYPRGDGSEQPFAPDTGHRTFESAFQDLRGRYLAVRLDLGGDGRSTPRLRALRVHYPRFSYLDRYLPAVYRDDRASASFLERFLANVEGIATTVEGRIAAADLLIDPRTTPAEALPWLASWLGLVLDPAWDEARRRLLLGNAARFFAWRGTIRGLQAVLALALDPVVGPSVFDGPSGRCARARIVELHRTGALPAPGAWSPEDGAQVLDDRYVEALDAAGVADPAARFEAVPPADPTRLAVWSAVASSLLGFVPAPMDRGRWQDFLARRYGRPADLATAHEAPDRQVFADVAVPTTLPQAQAALTDWYQFQTLVLRGVGTAHRFRVLLPVSAGDRSAPSSAADLAASAALAVRVVEQAKPAHTVFDVGFYWDAFRLGSARLGIDTIADLGARSPALLGPAVLGRAHLGENVLAAPATQGRTLLAERGCR